MALSQEQVEALRKKYNVKPKNNADIETLRQKYNIKPVGSNNTKTTPEDLQNAKDKVLKKESVFSKIDQLITGLGKSVLGSAKTAITPILDLPKNVASLAGKDIKGTNEIIPQDLTKAKEGTLETTGKAIGDVAQFLIPTGQAQKGASLLTKAGKSATDTLVKEVLQKGELDKETLKDAAISGAIPVVGEVVKKVGQGVAKIAGKTAERVINSLVKPLSKDFAYGKNPAKSITKYGITGNSLDELAQNIQTKIDDVGTQLDDVLKNTKTKVSIDSTKILNPIDDAINNLGKAKRTNATVINRLNDTKADILDIIGNKKTLTPVEARELKTTIGSLAKWTGNASDDKVVNKSIQQIYGNLKGKIEVIAPEAKTLSEDMANLITAKEATIYRDTITQRQNLVSLSGKTVGGIGILGGLGYYATTGDDRGLKTALAGIGLTQMDKVLGSSAFKTNLAKVLSTMKPEQVQNIVDKYPALSDTIRGIISTNE